MGTAPTKKLHIAQRANASTPNTVEQKSPLKIVAALFHSDRYAGGRCRLFPFGNPIAENLLKEMRAKDASQVGIDADTNTLHYLMSENAAVPGWKDRWVSVVLSDRVPDGDYLLEVPYRGKGAGGGGDGTFFQIVRIGGKFIAAGPKGEKLSPDPKIDPPVCDFVIGDGYSLEEAFFNHFAYCYGHLALLMEKTLAAAAKGEEAPEAGSGEAKVKDFKTKMGVARGFQESIGWILGAPKKAGENFFKVIKTLDKLVGNDSVAKKALLPLWEKSGVGKADLESVRKGVAGILIGADGEIERPKSTLEAVENLWTEKIETLEDSKAFRRISDPIEMAGKIMEFMGTTLEAAEVMKGFFEAEKAFMDFLKTSGKITWAIEARLTEPERDRLTYSGRMSPPPSGGGKSTPWERAGFFTRSDLTSLETLKMAEDHLSGTAHTEAAKFTLNMSSMAVGFCELVELLGKVGKAAKTVQKVATFVDEKIGTNEIEAALKRLQDAWHDAMADAHNNVEIHNNFFSSGFQGSGYQAFFELKAQFLLRAKALYGLKKLVDMCGPAVDPARKGTVCRGSNYVHDKADWLELDSRFSARVERFKVKEYVEKVILSDRFWVRIDHAESDWIHHWLHESDTDYRDAVLRTEDPGDPKTWYEVNFNRYWPIHFMDHEDIEEFCRDFSIDWSAVNRADIKRCFLQRGVSSWKNIGASGLSALTVSHWVTMGKDESIDSETPVRAVLEFSDAAKVRPGVPASFQVVRTDGFNVPGPIFNTLVRPLSSREHKSTGIPEGRFAAIVELTYSYRWKEGPVFFSREPKVFAGLKPLIETHKWYGYATEGLVHGVQSKMRHDDAVAKIPNPMTMMVTYAVGDGRIHGETDEVRLVPEYRMGPPDDLFDMRNRDKFCDLDFLQRLVAEEPPPKG